MRTTLITSLLSLLLVSGAFTQATAQNVEKKFWPKTVTTNRDQNIDLRDASGTVLANVPLPEGSECTLLAANASKLKVNVGPALAVLSIDSTDFFAQVQRRKAGGGTAPSPALVIRDPAAASAGKGSGSRPAAVASAGMTAGMRKLVEGDLMNASGKPVKADGALEGKITAFYFSASWCPPCRAFTPRLKQFHKQHSNQFEVILVGSDRSPESHQDYMKKYSMPWYAFPLGEKDHHKISRKWNVRGIPALIVVGPDGKVITQNGTSELGNPDQAWAKWSKSL